MKCNQDECDREANYLFTWPGKDQKGICGQCSYKLTQIADALGMYVQLIPIEEPQAEGSIIINKNEGEEKMMYELTDFAVRNDDAFRETLSNELQAQYDEISLLRKAYDKAESEKDLVARNNSVVQTIAVRLFATAFTNGTDAAMDACTRRAQEIVDSLQSKGHNLYAIESLRIGCN